MYHSSASKLFRQEVRDKKRTANGIHSRKGKRGYVGKMLFPVDFLKGKEKREYSQNGKVEVWNMYTEIMDYEKFISMSPQDQKEIMTKYRENFSNSEVMKKWGINHSAYYDLIGDLGIKKRHIIPKKKEVDQETLERYKNDVIDYKTFKTLPYHQQEIVLNEYASVYSSKELAELWDTQPKTVYQARSSLRKWRSKLDKEVSEQVTEGEEQGVKQEAIAFPESKIVPVETNRMEEKNEIRVEPVSNDIPNENHGEVDQTVSENHDSANKVNHGFTIAFEGEYTSKALAKKLQTIVALLEDDDRVYKMELDLQEQG